MNTIPRVIATGLAGLALLTSCAEDSDPALVERADADETETSEPADTTTTTTEKQNRFTVGDRVETDLGNEVQVFTYEQPVPPPDEWWTPAPGNEFAVIDVEACAGPEDDDTELRAVNPFDFELVMDDNTRLMSDIPAREPGLNHVDLPFAGDCARGFVTFQVPTGQIPAYIEDANAGPIRWAVK